MKRLLDFLWGVGLVVGLFYLSRWALTDSSRGWTFTVGIIAGLWLGTIIDRLITHLLKRSVNKQKEKR